jgi:phage baseplate assembly protein V
MADEFSKLERRLTNLEGVQAATLRFGEVTQVDEKAGAARVTIADAGKTTTGALRLLQPRTLKDQQQDFPDTGQQVACLLSGQGYEQGVVLGGVYSAKVPSPGRPPHVWYRKFEDGTEIEYDRVKHELVAKVKGSVLVQADKEITARSAISITLEAPDIFLNGNIHGTAAGSASFTAGSFSVNAGQVNLNEGCD